MMPLLNFNLSIIIKIIPAGTSTIKLKSHGCNFTFYRLLNPQRGYIKIEAYLPQILCHMTSDVKLSHYFLFIEVKLRRVPNIQIIQKTISKHHPLCECRETSTVEYISRYFNVLKFESQYKWTPPQIFHCGHRVLQLFCHNVEGAHDIKCGQK